ncbi:ketosynthase chain-length factor [Rhodococcus jostii]|uniref:Ketosynthase chain-length factor n=1 Tax=Rhodococcus jostii TaxID=132919 RepID=A0ABU4CT94_RHOJO|nr:ketosynthase chain-length factor [Rhodococcus jostii]MDV6286785.1 ketosynthase chain-length factor [Rhodococcus jostii]
MSAVAVTGLAVAAPNGLGVENYWSAVLAGRLGIDRISRYDVTGYPSQFAGEILDFDATTHIPSRLIPQTDPVTKLAIAVADWAIDDAAIELSDFDNDSLGVTTSNASGGFDFTQREVQKLWTLGPDHVSAYQCFAWFYAVNTGQISIKNDLRGAGGSIVADQAGGLDAIGHARRLINRGQRVSVAGGLEAPLNPYAFVSQISLGRLSRAESRELAYLPFDERAAGYVPGEGGALLILEDADFARERGARHVYGSIIGYGSSFDPHPDNGRTPNLTRAIRTALADANIAPEEVDVVFADAAGIPHLDAAEAEAITDVFGPHRVPVTAPKSTVGRLIAGGPPLDVATAFLALRDQVIPPTIGTEQLAAGYEIDLVTHKPRQTPLESAVVLARGFGGFNSALVLRR